MNKSEDVIRLFMPKQEPSKPQNSPFPWFKMASDAFDPISSPQKTVVRLSSFSCF